jgi:glutaconyl-CoA/methylmalonyl-CoA decarboxylase subunit delta
MSAILLNISNLNEQNVTVATVGLTIVFAALSVLYLFFSFIPKMIEWQVRMKLKRKGELKGKSRDELSIPVGVDAAIGAALYLYFGEIHDEENTIMTIKKVSKNYSPWSSKLYSMRWPLR